MIIKTQIPWLLTDCGEGRMLGPVILLDSLLVDSPVQARFEQHAKMWWRNPLHNLLCKYNKAYRLKAQCQCYLAQVYALDDYTIRHSYLRKVANRISSRYGVGKTTAQITGLLLKAKVL